MRSYSALYVDAGYLIASGATLVTGTSLRGAVAVEHARLVEALARQVEGHSSLPLLRVNWYDSGAAPGGAPDTAQEALGMVPRVKLRLGRISPNGEQKGVDLRLGLDLVTHGRNRVADVFYLLSGDDDLTEAVEEAQGHGVQVILLAVPDAAGRPHSVARHLLRESDGLLLIDAAIITATFHARGTRPAATAPATGLGTSTPELAPPPPTGPSPASLPARRSAPNAALLAAREAARQRQRDRGVDELARSSSALVYSGSTGQSSVVDADTTAHVDSVCQAVLAAWLRTATDEDKTDLLGRRPHIPKDIDRALLMDLSAATGVYDLAEHTKFVLRSRFWPLVEDALNTEISGRSGLGSD